MKQTPLWLEKILGLWQVMVAVIVGLSLGLIFTFFAGENPVNVMGILYRSAFGSWYDFGMTLFYTTSLIFSGLSVMVAYQGGLFNVGAEGQLTVGAFCCAAVGILFPHLGIWGPVFAILAAFVGGAIWAFIAAWLKAYRGCHEVISTIMLNFIAAGLTHWLTLSVLKNPLSQNPETQEILASFKLPQWAIFDGAPVSAAILLALVMVLVVRVFLWNTVWGYEIRALGQNEKSAEVAGISPKLTMLLVFAISGGLAGLVGVGEVLGNAGKFRIGFSPGLGFMGIAVALLGKSRPLGVLMAALLFGVLHKGTGDLDFETEHISRELSLILQAVVVLAVSALTNKDWSFAWIKKLYQRFTQNPPGSQGETNP